MLKHPAIGPFGSGEYFAAYKTPGASAMTVAACCTTLAQAEEEAARLNRLQIAAERRVRYDRLARGLLGVYPDLEG